MTQRKGIILAGGSGTRLYPLTLAVSKQLLPVYDKPLIYYPLTVLMLAGIKDILVITTPHDQPQFKALLGDGSQWGISICYEVQPSPDGFILAEDFLDGSPSAMVLGDNLFFGHSLPERLVSADRNPDGATVFGYHVSDPERYGVVGFDDQGQVRPIIEKPERPESNFAVTGLYFVDSTASQRAKDIKPSPRGELEITFLLESYLHDDALRVEKMGRGFAWLDTGTHGSLLDAGNFVRTLTERQGQQVGSPEEVAYEMGFISRDQVLLCADKISKTAYGSYLRKLVDS